MLSDDEKGLILLIEDNQNIAEMVGEYLERQGFTLDFAADGVTGLHLAVANSYDLIILDLMLPGLDGIEVCRKLRQEAKKSTPVLMLTARDTLDDKVEGLDVGADDYLVKPFDLDELLARLRVLARLPAARPPLLRHTDVVIDPAARTAHRAGRSLDLTTRELALLRYFVLHPGRLLAAEELIEHVWDANADPFSTSVRVILSRLRRKLGDPPIIHTVPGGGYRLGDPG